ncbi:hypothetical protein JK361_01715 [Streptomyces sp. 5-8]|uniref:DUF4352 domain-containing protein n=1 Tax=Streptomyces musisoli TaxID=2802280 RepID=A0ABS1NTT3_9ACTN|nr:MULTISPECIES: hypothetical protein [Streptomyces]MBL1103335.1 hypothetical protein [Streptomyces musisoli]MBY8845699.1 hypothetical protein [Streptomyces sp. SP2-10]
MSADTTPPPMPAYGPAVPPPAPPGKSRTVLVAAAAAVAAAVISALVTVGVTGGTEAKPAPTVTVTKTAAADDGAAAADDEATQAADDSADGADDEDGVYALDDTVVYEPDIEVALTGLKRAVTGEYADPENTPYLKFTVRLKNGGSKPIDATQLTVNCSYGRKGKSSDSVFDSEAGLEGGPETKLLSGRSLDVPWGCELPKGEKLIQIEVTPDFDSDPAIFTGDVK